MTALVTLLRTKRWVYTLLTSEVLPGSNPPQYRVSVVFEGESGHYPTGGGDTEPWYWTEETCRQMNERRGFDEETTWKIVASSMVPQTCKG